MNENKPYISLGNHLKYVREQAKRSLAEVSGAVEIEEAQLGRIEAGLERPDEDVLMLLINYFKVQDREAVQLWELADYDSDMPEEIGFSNDHAPKHQQTIMLLAMDVRTVYSDSVDIIANPAGLTLGFTQSAGTKQAATVAKVGMSLEQANQVAKAIEQALLNLKFASQHKLLPPPDKQL